MRVGAVRAREGDPVAADDGDAVCVFRSSIVGRSVRARSVRIRARRCARRGIAPVRSHQRPSASAAPRSRPTAARLGAARRCAPAGWRRARDERLAAARGTRPRRAAISPPAGSVSSNSTRQALAVGVEEARRRRGCRRAARRAASAAAATAATTASSSASRGRLHAGEEEPLLVAEVVVEQRLRDADRGRDLVHRHGRVAARGEQRVRGRRASAARARRAAGGRACVTPLTLGGRHRARRRAPAPARRTRRRAARASRRSSRAQRVDGLDHGLRALRREAAVLLELAALGLDRGAARTGCTAGRARAQRRRRALDRAANASSTTRSTHERAAVDDVVLAVDEHGERVAPGVDAALQPPRRAGEQVLLAPAEQLELGLARRAGRRRRRGRGAGRRRAGEQPRVAVRSATIPSAWPATNCAMPERVELAELRRW